MRSKAGLLLLCAALLVSALPAFAVEHAVAGKVTKIDSATKTIVVRLADGTEQAFKYTEHTAVHAAKAGSKAAKKGAVESYLAVKEGSDVVVHYTGEGANKTATVVNDYGRNAFKVSKGTVVKANQAAHTFTVRTADGAEHTYRVAKDASMDTGQGIVKGTKYDVKKGEKVVVHYSD